MDQKRLFLAIAASLAILLGFQLLVAPHVAKQMPPTSHVANVQHPVTTPREGAPDAGAAPSPATETPSQAAVPRNVPRVKIDAPQVEGSISLLGARLDDLVLKDYHEEISPSSPLVRLLEPRSEDHPYYIQYGWTAPAGEDVKLPGNDTVWAASTETLTPATPVTLSWDNGAGLTFQIELSIDDHYMFSVQQTVKNATGQAVKLFPWSRIRRDYEPKVAGYYVLFKGLLGVVDGTLQETTYSKAKSEGEKKNGIAYEADATGGWAGITDKYWLTSLIPDQSVPSKVKFYYQDDNGNHYQADYITQDPQTVPAGGSAELTTHTFAGAKVVSLLDQYESQYHIPSFDKAVDFGWFYFLTKPIFFALDFLNRLFGNFGVAILVFTVLVKGLFFPLANYSYRSMSKMKLLSPKMTAIRERFKDDPQKMQQEMMGLYKAEKVNPASGCLPMLVQIPVFFSLYKVIFVTIEMRQAPFFGWIHDLSQVDPTNVFNLFGLIPFNPAHYLPLLHLGAWPLIMGITMFLQQKMNPPPPDPTQARLFQFMPIVFTFMMASFPAGLIIYWSWNNTLSIAQQWLIQRQTRLTKPSLART
ncbi:membrane protein insertase YidC [Rhodopila globiformis]|uniref:Membrane protein insertase YidC n=1 Tax=Rhodopila globiformis TaxID=1071 RepID=A0A2S6MU53_RHOGL|nr:membrane protein insertase YidC [Rhodopila globiformis]PPQ25888.1 membrane protein insertase YidC [Rhodopila globiformis]